MSMIIDGTAGITFNNATTQASAGVVLQAVQGTYSTNVTNSTSTYADTGVTATITPKFSTSKVLVMVSMNGVIKKTSDTAVNFKIQKNGSDLVIYTAGMVGYTATTTQNGVGSSTCNYLDSPGSISALTYKVQFASNANNATASVQESNGSGVFSSITLMEIAA